MVNPLLKSQKIGFLGTGNMAQAVIRGMLENKVVKASQILASNRSEGKLQKLADLYGIIPCDNNEEVVETSDIIVLAMKPQDLIQAIEPIARSFQSHQIVISLAAGVRMETLQKHLPECRMIRLMPNTPSLIGRGMIGYLLEEPDESLAAITEDLFSPLGKVIAVDDEDQFEAFMVSCSSGTGFVFEMMMYWQDWITEHGFSPEEAQQMTVETFLGAASLAAQSQSLRFEELQARVTSKKGVTAAGLESMRELEIERALRISFEKAAMRNKEMGQQFR